MNKNIKEAFKQRGLFGVARYCIQKIAGLQQLEEKIDTLHFFIEKSVDIQSFPKADGGLRKLQIADSILLAIVDRICRNNDLEYWIDAGTFLGAYRHKGFIPWDDDIDISMMRDTYERALPILRNELAKFGISASEASDEQYNRMGIGYQHEKTGIWIDLFPYEYVSFDPNDALKVRKTRKEMLKYKNAWRGKGKKSDRMTMARFLQRTIPEICSKTNAKSIIDVPAFSSKQRVFEIDEIFNCREILFEGYMLKCPNQCERFLTKLYGAGYMNYPESGVLHHDISTRAEKNGIDMDEAIEKLKTIYDTIKNQKTGM